MTLAHNFLEIVHKVGSQGYELRKVYRRIQDRELFLIAYGNLYANKGAMTAGVDPSDTVDGMSLDRIDDIIAKLKNGTYVWQPVKRIEIPKKNGKKRPLGIPTWSDKLLQEVIRLVLEAYYEPQFSDFSHGFRPNRGCHTALSHIYHNWKGTKWFIEGDIKGCFDNIDHEILLGIIGRKIKDQKFLKLLREMLEAGYTQDWKYHQTYSGTPQGGVISPILSNIMLNELDQFMENELLPAYNRGEKKADNKEYQQLSTKIRKARRHGNKELCEELLSQRRKLPSQEPNDPNYRRLKYMRYADDFALGFDGPKQEACEIKEKVSCFIQTIKLEMSFDATLITHAASGRARFLGYEIYIAWDNEQLSKRRNNPSVKSRAINGTPILSAPKDVVQEWKGKYSRNGKPIHRLYLTHCSDFEIVRTYGVEFQGLVNYYTLAHDVAEKLYPVKYVLMESLAKTIAAKHKKRKTWVYRKYKRTSDEGVKAIIVEVPNPNNPNKPLSAKFGDKAIKSNRYVHINDSVKKFYSGRNELVRRLLANECELCGSSEKIEVHHVHKLKEVKKKYEGRKNPPAWALFMMERNRKTVVVCKSCHTKIHQGKYDGRKVE